MIANDITTNPDKIPRIEVIGVTGIPEIQTGDHLGELIARAAANQKTPIKQGDILVVTQKIVSKAEDRLVQLSTVDPSPFAIQIASECELDPRLVELVLKESRAIVRMDPARGILIAETKQGLVCANAGIDTSNIPNTGVVSLLPKDPDNSARNIRDQLRQIAPEAEIAVIISDTFGRAWREGHINLAIGISGMNPMKDYRGTHDAYGKTLKTTNIATADELASAAELVNAKAAGIPAAIIRGVSYSLNPDSSNSLIRNRSTDLFR